jgi:hypothetical protein
LLRNELEKLFGKQTVKAAGTVDPSKIDAPSVQQAVGALLLLRGRPEAQARYVQTMPEQDAAVLCRWLADRSFWKQAAGVQTH